MFFYHLITRCRSPHVTRWVSTEYIIGAWFVPSTCVHHCTPLYTTVHCLPVHTCIICSSSKLLSTKQFHLQLMKESKSVLLLSHNHHHLKRKYNFFCHQYFSFLICTFILKIIWLGLLIRHEITHHSHLCDLCHSAFHNTEVSPGDDCNTSLDQSELSILPPD